MPNPKRPIVQQIVIKEGGGNIHLIDPNKPSEQVRISQKAARKLRGN